MRQGIFLPESASSADSLTVSVQPPRAIVCISICVYDKNPKHWQLYCCLDTRTILHTLVGMGSAAILHTQVGMGSAAILHTQVGMASAALAAAVAVPR